MKISTDL